MPYGGGFLSNMFRPGRYAYALVRPEQLEICVSEWKHN
jgi:hypothetical protein